MLNEKRIYERNRDNFELCFSDSGDTFFYQFKINSYYLEMVCVNTKISVFQINTYLFLWYGIYYVGSELHV